MKKALRMKMSSYILDEEFEKNFFAVKNNLDVIDEITLFVDATHHGYTPIDKIRSTADIVKRRIAQYKDAGVTRVGINVLCTLGHTDDGDDIYDKADLQYMQDIDGMMSSSCICPSDNRVIDYIKEKYEIFSNVGADYIWMDDDVRVGNHGKIKGFCFCPCCLSKYNERYNTNYDIDYVRNHWDADGDLRDNWKESIFHTMTMLVATIRDAVSGDIELGYMSGGNNYVYEWIDSSKAVKGRPGGGFYNDRMPIDLFGKAFWIQKELTQYPERVRDIQYEYETFNSRTLEKSNHISEVESSLCLMLGCNGVLYNRAYWYEDQPFFDMMRRSSRKWDLIEKVNDGCHNIGVYCVSALSGKQLNEISIPVSAVLENSLTAFVQGDEWNLLRDSEISAVLEKNVLTDAKGLEILLEKGYLTELSCTIKQSYRNGVVEKFTDHIFNEKYMHMIRPISMDLYYEGDAYIFLPPQNATCLSSLTSNTEILGTSMFAIEEGGRRYAVDGCLMPNQMQTASKRCQLMNLFDWLSKGTLPIIIHDPVKIIPTVTGRGEAENIMLCNASFDGTGEVTVEIRSDKTFYILTESGELESIKQKIQNGKAYVTIDNISPWGYVVITSVK